MTKLTTLIVGSSGLVGNELLKILLDSDNYEIVNSLVRKASGVVHPKLREFVIDFDNIDKFSNAFAVDDAFCCLGTTIKKAGSQDAFKKVDVDYVLNFTRVAKSLGAKKIAVISSMGANPNSSIFYNRMKGLMELGVTNSGIEYVLLFRPSLLLGNRKESRFGEKFASKIVKPFMFLFSGPLKRYRPILASDVAKGIFNHTQSANKGVSVFMSHLIFPKEKK